jgi:hypothetical protein
MFEHSSECYECPFGMRIGIRPTKFITLEFLKTHLDEAFYTTNPNCSTVR